LYKQNTVKEYIAAHEKAYEKINGIFDATLPTKMKFYIWFNNDTAKKYLNHELGFTRPDICVSEVNINQTIGHEMTHTFSCWAWGTKPIKITRFINEGIAVAFDQQNDDKLRRARIAIANTPVSILAIWANNADPAVLYPVAGAFITYIYKISTPAQFRSLVKDQTVESAYKIYGREKFDSMIKDFESQLTGSK